MLLILEICLTILATIYIFFKWNYQTFKNRGVPFIEPSFPVGSTTNIITKKEHLGLVISKFQRQFKDQGHKIGGIFLFRSPIFILCHPETIKTVLTKDFVHFTDRGSYVNERDDPLTGNLFSLEGTDWRHMRVKLTPTFTSGKMKLMYPLLLECCNQFVDSMRTSAVNKEPVMIKDVFSRFTLDVIGSCAFGLECETVQNEDSEFRKIAKKFFPTGSAKGAVIRAFPKLARLLRFRSTNKDLEDFFMKLTDDTINYRKTNKVVRNDFLQMLMEIQDKEEMTFRQLVAQCFLFFVAGYETSSTLAMYCFYALTKHPDVQEKVRGEIKQVIKKHDGQLTYEALPELKYLDMILEETLRRYPPGLLSVRKCTRDWTDPDTGVLIKTGELVMFSKHALVFDPEYFPEPEKFDPERFNPENRKKIVPFTFMPFGEGPRNCIGMRFGKMQSKVGVAMLLNKYKFTLSERTKEPLVPNPRSIVNLPIDPIILDVREL